MSLLVCVSKILITYVVGLRNCMQQLLITFGVLLILLGLAWPWVSQLPLGRLPGDIHIERENFSFHVPLMTGLLISVVLSLILWWTRK